jgi:hypothetical protein
MDPAWRAHLEALKRFNTWEDAQLRGLREDYSQALAWMADAWIVARRVSPDWLSPARGDEHVEHLVSLQRALAEARLSP